MGRIVGVKMGMAMSTKDANKNQIRCGFIYLFTGESFSKHLGCVGLGMNSVQMRTL